MKFLVGTTQFLVGIFLVGTFFGTAAAEAATLRQPDTTVNCTYLSMIISTAVTIARYARLVLSPGPQGRWRFSPGPLCRHPR